MPATRICEHKEVLAVTGAGKPHVTSNQRISFGSFSLGATKENDLAQEGEMKIIQRHVNQEEQNQTTQEGKTEVSRSNRRGMKNRNINPL